MTNEKEMAERAKLIRRMAEIMATPAYTEGLLLAAQDRFMKYQTYMKAGFSSEQALQLLIADNIG